MITMAQPPMPPFLNRRLSPSRSYSSPPGLSMPSSPLSSRKRSRQDDDTGDDDRMSQSPSASPSIPAAALPQTIRRIKKMRTNLNGRPLALNRLLETLSADDMRGLLTKICERRPDLGAQITAGAPRPSITNVLSILDQYEQSLRQAFPVGNQTSDYAYNRVKQQLQEMYEALRDYTPQFLPPNEPHPGVSLDFLDQITHVLHRLPTWETYSHNRLKAEAYDEISKAWAIAIGEAAKKGAGIQLQVQGWDQKLLKHNDASGGKLEEAMTEMRSHLGWMGSGSIPGAGMASGGAQQEMSIRDQLFSGTYGAQSVRVGPW